MHKSEPVQKGKSERETGKGCDINFKLKCRVIEWKKPGATLPLVDDRLFNMIFRIIGF